MKKSTHRRLELSRETLRSLNHPILRGVRGGTVEETDACPGTEPCALDASNAGPDCYTEGFC